MFKTPEYQHLLMAERVMADTLEREEGKTSELAQCARALVDIIQMKRNMRGQPNPKPIDVQQKQKTRRHDPNAGPSEPPPHSAG